MTLEVPKGDELEISFSLNYKLAAVARRPDKDRFAYVVLHFFTPAGGKNKDAVAPSWCTPHRIKVTKDDQPVTFHAVLHDPQGGIVFDRGETWGIAARYVSEQDEQPEPHYELPLYTFKVV